MSTPQHSHDSIILITPNCTAGSASWTRESYGTLLALCSWILVHEAISHFRGMREGVGWGGGAGGMGEGGEQGDFRGEQGWGRGGGGDWGGEMT